MVEGCYCDELVLGDVCSFCQERDQAGGQIGGEVEQYDDFRDISEDDWDECWACDCGALIEPEQVYCPYCNW